MGLARVADEQAVVNENKCAQMTTGATSRRGSIAQANQTLLARPASASICALFPAAAGRHKTL